MIQERIVELAEYGVATGLTGPEDRCYTINRLLELFCLEEPGDAACGKLPAMTREEAEAALEGILAEMLDYATEKKLIPENTITYRH